MFPSKINPQCCAQQVHFARYRQNAVKNAKRPIGIRWAAREDEYGSIRSDDLIEPLCRHRCCREHLPSVAAGLLGIDIEITALHLKRRLLQ